MLTRELQHTIHRTFDEALQRRHEYVTLEHLLYALIDEKTGSDVIQNCGGNIIALKHELEQFLTQGIETLPVRMERHCSNAEKLVDWLAEHPMVEGVVYPGREGHPTEENACRYLRRGGGMLGLYVKGGFEAAKRVATITQIFSHAANMGDCKSLIIHPASTTHSPVDPAVRRSIGIADNYLRLSVGLEHVDDLKDDLDRALRG